MLVVLAAADGGRPLTGRPAGRGRDDVGILLGLLAGANVWQATRLRHDSRISCRRARLSLAGLLPATFTATVCCGVPLAAVFGLSTATLFAGASFATAASIGILTGNLARLLGCRHGPAVARADLTGRPRAR